jgi:hypothetical protein
MLRKLSMTPRMGLTIQSECERNPVLPSARSLFRILLASILAVGTHVVAQTAASPASPKPIACAAPSKATYLKFADETEAILRQDVLGVW